MKSSFLYFLLFFIYGNCFAIDPKKEYISTPVNYGIEFTEFFIETTDNYNICVWDCIPKKIITNKTILLTYGDYGNMSYYLPYIKLYTDLGYRVISFDYRGFGKSSYFKIDNENLYYKEFVEDLDSLILYCKNSLKINTLGIVSLSMGSLLTALSNQKYNLDFLIIEGAVYDCKIIVERLERIKNKKYKLPIDIYLPLFWKELKCKVLILAGDKDNITTKEDSVEIINQNKLNRSLVLYKGGHLSALNTGENKAVYLREIKLFLQDE